MQNHIFQAIFREKPALMLLTLLNSENQVYASTISKKIDCTYSHIVKILKEFEKEGLITFNKKGRLKIINLTKKGEDVSRSINAIHKILK